MIFPSRQNLFSLLLIGCALTRPERIAGAEPLPDAQNETTARVVVVYDPDATVAFTPSAEIARTMLNRAVTNLAGTNSTRNAWRSLVSTADIVGIKVFSSPGPNSGTRPCVVAPIIEGLLEAGLPADRIIIWDRQITDLRLSGFSDLARRYKVRLAGAAQEGFDDSLSYDTALLGNLVWGDLEFGKKGQGI